MATGFIPQEIIDDIAARSDIVEIVNEYVPLKQKGKYYFGLCPFHNEKTPSFSVTPDKQIFHCFGCGVGGNIFNFLMQIEGLSYVEAIEKLAQRAGVSLPKQELSQAQQEALKQKERLFKINGLASKFYHKVLIDTKWGIPALNYLKKRGIDKSIIEKFQLGAAPPGWDSLFKFMIKKGVKIQELLDLGLILAKRSSNGYYDRFRNRLMFPIWDNSGNVIAFGGRVLDEEEQPKYLNSPDTSLFNKGQHLYGLHLAKSTMRSQDLAIIVEGYMDAIACHQFGITNTVASLGTAFTKQQAKAIMRSTYQVAIAYDADTAGSNATLRGLDILTDFGCQVKVVTLPQGSDPDDYLRNYGVTEFQKLVAKGQSLIEYKLFKAMENVNISSIVGKTKVIQSVLPDLYKIASPVARESAVRIIGTKLGLTDTAILSELRKYSQEKQKFPANKDRNLERRENNINNEFSLAKFNKVEIQLLKLVFEHNKFFQDIEKAGGKELFTPPLRELYQELWLIYQKKNKITSTDLSENKSELLAKVLMQELQVPDINKAVADYIKNLVINKLDKDYSDKQKQLREIEKMGEPEKLTEILQQIDFILQKKKSLAP